MQGSKVRSTYIEDRKQEQLQSPLVCYLGTKECYIYCFYIASKIPRNNMFCCVEYKNGMDRWWNMLQQGDRWRTNVQDGMLGCPCSILVIRFFDKFHLFVELILQLF